MTRIAIEETTVGQLAGVRVGMGNAVLSGDFELPDGSRGEGPACGLFWEDGDAWVGLGSELTLAGTTWRVIEITKERGVLGTVVLEAL